MNFDEFDEAFQSLEVEVFKVELLFDWFVHHEGISEMAVFLESFSQTIGFLRQSFDEVKVSLPSIMNFCRDGGGSSPVATGD